MRKFQRRATNGEGQKWCSEEEGRLLELIERGKTVSSIAVEFPGRSKPSLRAKIRKLRLREDLFGSSYRDQKSGFTAMVGQSVQPDSVFDAYAGHGHQTMVWARFAPQVFAVERNRVRYEGLIARLLPWAEAVEETTTGWRTFCRQNRRVSCWHGDALEAAVQLRACGTRITVLDLDTCGTTIPTVGTFCQLLRPREMVITHGEFHSLRFARDDVLRRLLLHRGLKESKWSMSVQELMSELDLAVKLSCFRSHNLVEDSYYPTLRKEVWLGEPQKGMLRRWYRIDRPVSSADCLNDMLKLTSDTNDDAEPGFEANGDRES